MKFYFTLEELRGERDAFMQNHIVLGGKVPIVINVPDDKGLYEIMDKGHTALTLKGAVYVKNVFDEMLNPEEEVDEELNEIFDNIEIEE